MAVFGPAWQKCLVGDSSDCVTASEVLGFGLYGVLSEHKSPLILSTCYLEDHGWAPRRSHSSAETAQPVSWVPGMRWPLFSAWPFPWQLLSAHRPGPIWQAALFPFQVIKALFVCRHPATTPGWRLLDRGHMQRAPCQGTCALN